MGFDITLDPEKCNGCEECIEACTAGVLEMRNGKSLGVQLRLKKPGSKCQIRAFHFYVIFFDPGIYSPSWANSFLSFNDRI